MRILYSNILPLGTDEGQKTITETFNEYFQQADHVEIAVGYVSRASLEELDDMSGAKVGDKTMMDAVIPASQAIADYAGDSESELFAKLGEIYAVEGRDAAQSALVTEVYWPEEFSMWQKCSMSKQMKIIT